jgi:DNA primase
MATWVNFRELREKLDFRAVLQQYDVAIHAGNGVQHHGKCPLPTHQGQRKSTSFSANLERGIWRCFGCGAQGNILDFATRMDKGDPSKPDDVRKTALLLAERYGIVSQKPGAAAKKPPAPANVMTVVNAPLDFSLKNLDPDHPYLRDRGFTKETIARFELGFCSRGLMKDRIAIPLRDPQGKLIGYAGRVVDDAAITEENPKYRFPGMREHDGKRFEFSKGLFLYNGHAVITPAEELVVVEGFAAVWWCVQHGFNHVVGLMAATCSAEQAALIVGMVPRKGKIWIMPDGDQQGKFCAESLLKQLSPFRMARWPELKGGRKPQQLSGDELRERLS